MLYLTCYNYFNKERWVSLLLSLGRNSSSHHKANVNLYTHHRTTVMERNTWTTAQNDDRKNNMTSGLIVSSVSHPVWVMLWLWVPGFFQSEPFCTSETCTCTQRAVQRQLRGCALLFETQSPEQMVALYTVANLEFSWNLNFIKSSVFLYMSVFQFKVMTVLWLTLIMVRFRHNKTLAYG